MGSELRLYDVTVGNRKTRMRLSAADAKALAGVAVTARTLRPAAVVKPVPAEQDPKSRLVTSNKMRGTDEPTTVNVERKVL